MEPSTDLIQSPRDQNVTNDMKQEENKNVERMASDVDSSDDEDSEELEDGEIYTNIPIALDIKSHNAVISDLDVAAEYAENDLQSVATQFSIATVSEGISTETTNSSMKQSDMIETMNTKSKDERKDSLTNSSNISSSENEEEDEQDNLRAEIEAAMVKEDNRLAQIPLTTAHEVVHAPIRTPEIDRTKEFPVTQCGSVLNVNSQMSIITVKSDANQQPLDEGSILCLQDRTVLGCVDEIFGPVSTPMYVIRFENQDDIPTNAKEGAIVYFATEHITYVNPSALKDKGSDASNLYDEETNEIAYSDDEQELAAKRERKKRSRNGKVVNTTNTMAGMEKQQNINTVSNSGKGKNGSGKNDAHNGGRRNRGVNHHQHGQNYLNSHSSKNTSYFAPSHLQSMNHMHMPYPVHHPSHGAIQLPQYTMPNYQGQFNRFDPSFRAPFQPAYPYQHYPPQQYMRPPHAQSNFSSEWANQPHPPAHYTQQQPFQHTSQSQHSSVQNHMQYYPNMQGTYQDPSQRPDSQYNKHP